MLWKQTSDGILSGDMITLLTKKGTTGTLTFWHMFTRMKSKLTEAVYMGHESGKEAAILGGILVLSTVLGSL